MNHNSIIVDTAFNELWGQYEISKAYSTKNVYTENTMPAVIETLFVFFFKIPTNSYSSNDKINDMIVTAIHMKLHLLDKIPTECLETN